MATYSAAFLEFWTHYPRRVGKGAAWKAWGKVPAEVHTTIFAAIEWQVEQPSWLKDGGAFIPYPATWLNQCRWEDEPFVPVMKSYHGWACPHTPPCEQRHWCELKIAKASLL